MKQISVYFNTDMYLQTESNIRNLANAKKCASIYHKHIHSSNLRTYAVYTHICTLQVPLTELDGTISISSLSNDEDDTSLLRLEI